MRAALQPQAQPDPSEPCSLLLLCPHQPPTTDSLLHPALLPGTEAFGVPRRASVSDSFVLYCSRRAPVAATPEAFNRTKVGAC